MRTPFRFLPAMMAGLLGLLLAPSVRAQTYTWDGGAGSWAWNAAGNWVSDTLPLSASSTTIVLTGSTQTVTNQNLADPFLLNRTRFDSGASTFSIFGQPLHFVADGMTLPTITLDSANYSHLDGPVLLGADLTINGTTLGTGGAGYDLLLNGRVSGSGGLTVNFANPSAGAVLNGRRNTYTGSTTVTSGTLWLTAVNAVSRSSAVTIDDLLFLDPATTERGVTAGSYDQRIGSLAGASAGYISLGAARLTVGFDGTSTGYSGVIDSSTGGLSKVGLGGLTLLGSNLYSGSTNIEGGTLTLAGAIANSSTISIAQPASLAIDNQAAVNSDRLADSATLELRGGFLTFIGHDSLATSETTGTLSLARGQSVLDMIPGVTAGASLTFSNLSVGTGTVLFIGGVNNLGNAPGAGVANVAFTTAPTLVNGVLPAALATGSDTLDSLAFATHGTHGIRPFQSADYVTSLLTAASTETVRQTANVTVASSITRNALALSGDGLTLTVNASQSLTLTSGGLILLPGGTGSSITGPGSLTFGSGGASPAYIAVEGGIATVSTTINSASLVKSGFGTLTLTNSATLGAVDVNVNAGTLAVTGSAPLGSAPNIRLSGATLDVVAVTGFTLNAGQTLVGTGSILGNMTLGGVLAPSAQPGPGTLVVGGMTWLGGGRYDWRINSVDDGEFTQSLLNGTGTLDLMSPTLTSSNRFEVKLLSLAADNTPGATSDFNREDYHEWKIATFAGGIVGFDVNDFTIDASQFSAVNDTTNGVFALTTIGNDLVVTFTPVPEPASLLALSAFVLAANRYRRRMRSQAPRAVTRGCVALAFLGPYV